jgi:RNA polymerase-binding transcription factor DksA
VEDQETRSLLEAERERLQRTRETLVAEAGLSERLDDSFSELASVDNHPADVGTETFEREKILSIIEAVDAQLEDIEHALHRLEGGTYGLCEACGRPIPDDRLRAQPAARFCLEDQQRAERATRAGA